MGEFRWCFGTESAAAQAAAFGLDPVPKSGVRFVDDDPLAPYRYKNLIELDRFERSYESGLLQAASLRPCHVRAYSFYVQPTSKAADGAATLRRARPKPTFGVLAYSPEEL
jgi:hypothetical protein